MNDKSQEPKKPDDQAKREIEEALTVQRRRLFGHSDAAQKLDYNPNPNK